MSRQPRLGARQCPSWLDSDDRFGEREGGRDAVASRFL
jgi:hypothetical protein